MAPIVITRLEPAENPASSTRVAVSDVVKVPVPALAVTVPSTVSEPALSSTEIRPVESLATVTRSAVASTPPPFVTRSHVVPSKAAKHAPTSGVVGLAMLSASAAAAGSSESTGSGFEALTSPSLTPSAPSTSLTRWNLTPPMSSDAMVSPPVPEFSAVLSATYHL